MTKIEKHIYKKQVILRVLITISLITVFVITSNLSISISKNVNFGMIVLLVASLIISVLMNCENQKKPIIINTYMPRKKNNQTTENSKYISIILLITSLYIMVSNHTIYGFWDLFFLYINPSLIVGLMFILAIILSLLIRSKIIRVLLIPLMLTYPIQYLNFSNKWMLHGTIISGMFLVEIIHYVSNLLNTQKHNIEDINFKVIKILLKLILPVLLVSLVLFFTIGYNSFSSFANVIYIQRWKSAVLLLPILILIILDLLELNLKLNLLVFLILNLILNFTLNGFMEQTNYSDTNFIIFKMTIQYEGFIQFYIVLCVKVIVTSSILITLCLVYHQWCILNSSFMLVNKSNLLVNKYKNNHSYEYKFFILKNASLNAFFHANNQLDFGALTKIKTSEHSDVLVKYILLIFSKTIIMYLLPLNAIVLSVFSNQYFYNYTLLINLYYSIFSIYVSLLFILIVIFWTKFQNFYLKSKEKIK